MGETYLALLRRLIHLKLAVKEEVEEWRRDGVSGRPLVAETRAPG